MNKIYNIIANTGYVEEARFAWNYSGNIRDGVLVIINESAEHVLASRQEIIENCDIFNGKFISHGEGGPAWPRSSCLTMQNVSISPIAPKEIKRPDETPKS